MKRRLRKWLSAPTRLRHAADRQVRHGWIALDLWEFSMGIGDFEMAARASKAHARAVRHYRRLLAVSGRKSRRATKPDVKEILLPGGDEAVCVSCWNEWQREQREGNQDD